ncbi:replication protein RepA, partial [Shewanella xiamenensis]|nr:replication protein RepA [Shewanella xiamenensis]
MDRTEIKLLPITGTESLYSGNLLIINSATSVQPIVLLRTGIFTTVGRKTNLYEVKTQEHSNELVHLDLCKNEGYDIVTVKG